MFTGLVQDVGEIIKLKRYSKGMRLTVKSKFVSEKIKIDDSVSVNGCCQTVVEYNESQFTVDVVESTLVKSNFKKLKIGDRVNLELALRVGDRIGGHIVQGHVNAIGRLLKVTEIENFYKIEISYDSSKHSSLLTNEGSISVNGVSLTVNSLNDSLGTFDIYVIPHTWKSTVFRYIKVGEDLNLEFDIFAHYMNRIIDLSNKNVTGSKTLLKFLKEK